MLFEGKTVLFVEGECVPRPRLPEPLDTIWRHHLVNALGLSSIARIIPISKKNVLALDDTARVSGVGTVPLDVLIARELETEPFDAAVVAWDLLPPWDKNATVDKWSEVLSLYRGLAASQVLPDKPWLRWAQSRFQALSRRARGCQRGRPPRLEAGAVLAVCMEPTFESLLLVCEDVIRRTLGVGDGRKIGWPSWSGHGPLPEEVIQSAIQAASKIRPKTQAIKSIHGDMITAKNEWGEYLLREMIRDGRCLNKIKRHPTAVRLIDLLSAS